KHVQFSLIWGKAENRVEGGGLACTIGTDQSEDAALFNTQIDTVQRDGCAERLTEPTCFYACHGLSVPPLFYFSTLAGGLRHSPTILPASGRAAEWLLRFCAILHQETSAVRPAATNCVRRH